MPQDKRSWDVDRALTYRGVGPAGGPGLSAPAPGNHTGYRLGARIGTTGQVYEAENVRFAGSLVIKLFPFAAGVSPSAAAAFAREATQIAQLRHPHVAQVVDAGTLADGTPFVTMERLVGQTLEERIAGPGPLPVAELLPLIRGIASALSVAHAAGVVHGELRADNVFVASLTGYESGFAKLLDFGVARLTAAALAVGRIIGTGAARTLAPEQRPGSLERVDERTDQFAFGVLTYRLLTGTDPGAALESGPGFERMPPGGSRPAANLLRSAPAVDAVLGKAMSRRPEHRFDSIALFFRALEESLAGAAHVAGAVGVRGEPARTENTETTLAPTFDEPLQPDPSATTRNTARSMVAEAPAQGSARASLTQQFFAEGERQEATRWKDSPLVNDDEDDARDSRKVFDSFDRVPRRRAPFVAATALIIVGAAIAAWATGWRPRAVWFAISSGGASPAPAVTAPATPTPPIAVTPPAAAPPAPPTIAVAPPIVASPPITTPATATPPAAAAAADPGSGETAPEAPVAAAPERARDEAAPARAPAPAQASPAAKPRGEDRDDRGEARPEPLRGFVWSPSQQRLVPAELAPPQTESGPPPVSELPRPPSTSATP